MTAKHWLLLLALGAALAFLQHGLLEQTPEKLQENVYTNIADLPPGEMVSAYVGSLFLGSFRAVAIDVFWIQLKQALEDRRWYLAREIAEMISILQPHNEEVWSMLAWEFAYNAAEGERLRSEEAAWQWIRYGILKLREGIRRNPKSPYLRFQLAFFLKQKPSWRQGVLDMSMLRRVEEDEEIQRQLQDVEKVREKRSCFELAMKWFEAARIELEKNRGESELFYKTQMGIYLRTDSMDTWIRECMFFQGIYCWYLARLRADSPYWERAKEWFARAKTHTVEMRRKYTLSALVEDLLELYEHMPEVLDASRGFTQAMTSSDGTERRRALQEYASVLESVLEALGLVEESHLLAALSPARQDLSQEQIREGNRLYFFEDEFEYNDLNVCATPSSRKPAMLANLRPAGDVDRFSIHFASPQTEEVFVPKNVTLRVGRVGQLPLLVRVFTSTDILLLTREVRGEDERFQFTADKPGTYYVDIRAWNPPTELPPDTRYGIAFEIEE